MKPPKRHIKRPGKDPSSEESSSKCVRTLPKALKQKKTGKVNSDHAVAEQHATTDQADSGYNQTSNMASNINMNTQLSSTNIELSRPGCSCCGGATWSNWFRDTPCT